jgi:TRAP-type C4-dicarboxylate transport system substrate-binding protein
MKIRSLFAALALAAGLGSAAHAEAEYTLTISSWGPPTSGNNASMWPEIIKRMEEATGGRVTGELKFNLAPPPAQFDLILDGAADMTWIFHGYNPGRFVSSQLFELPGYDADSATLSAAYWQVYQDHFAKLNEHRGVKLIGLMTHGPGQLASATKIDKLSDIADLKIRTGGGVAGEVVALLGASRIQLPAPSAYEAIASKAADASMMTIEGRKSYNLVEVAPYMYEMPGGFYRGSFALLMNQEKFDAMPKDLQEALDGVFGLETSRLAGAVWDDIDREGRQATLDTPGNEIIVASPEDQAEFAKLAATVKEQVFASIRGAGADPEAAYAEILSLISK